MGSGPGNNLAGAVSLPYSIAWRTSPVMETDMVDEDNTDGGGEPADPKSNRKADKPKTAVKGNAPGGPDFSSANGPMASGRDAVLGAQVRPETQTREDDGHRTLAAPVTDPGPVLKAGQQWKHPDTSKGETIGSVNQPLTVSQRTSTSPDWAGRPGHNMGTVDLAPELTGLHSTASDVYNKERGEGLTDRAKELASQPRVAAPGAFPTEGEADTVETAA